MNPLPNLPLAIGQKIVFKAGFSSDKVLYVTSPPDIHNVQVAIPADYTHFVRDVPVGHVFAFGSKNGEGYYHTKELTILSAEQLHKARIQQFGYSKASPPIVVKDIHGQDIEVVNLNQTRLLIALYCSFETTDYWPDLLKKLSVYN